MTPPTKANKFLVAILAPVVAAILPFLSDDGFQPADVGPIIVGVLVALGVYAVPNPPVGKGKGDGDYERFARQ